MACHVLQISTGLSSAAFLTSSLSSWLYWCCKRLQWWVLIYLVIQCSPVSRSGETARLRVQVWQDGKTSCPGPARRQDGENCKTADDTEARVRLTTKRGRPGTDGELRIASVQLLLRPTGGGPLLSARELRLRRRRAADNEGGRGQPDTESDFLSQIQGPPWWRIKTIGFYFL
jgi:hypothetical protein